MNAAAPIATAARGGTVTGAYIAGFWNAPRKCSSPASATVPSSEKATSPAVSFGNSVRISLEPLAVVAAVVRPPQ